jgi:hypothetical protein
MSNTLQFIMAMACLIPAIPAAVKFGKTERSYHPFFLLLFAAVITELVADLPILLYNNYSLSFVVHPLYYTLEIFLMLLFYRRNNILIGDVLLWLVPLTGGIVYALNYYSYQDFESGPGRFCVIGFTIVNLMLSVKLLSNEIFETKTKAIENPKMVIAFGCMLFYAYYLMIKVMLYFNTQVNIWLGIFTIHQIMNCLTYLIFTWAIIWIPSKKTY